MPEEGEILLPQYLYGTDEEGGTTSELVGKKITITVTDWNEKQTELEYLVFEPRKEFITMVVLAVGNIPLLYFLNQSWYDTLMHTIPGQIMLAVTGAIIFVSTACVIKLTKPIEYRT